MTSQRVLQVCFATLPDNKLENLVYHAERNTPICCGDEWIDYLDGYGGG